MKILITEVEMDSSHKSVSYITLKSNFQTTWNDGCKEYEITDYIIETIQDQEVFGWIDGVNRFGKPVKRTYMLVPQ